jgi:hypothetical protein
VEAAAEEETSEDSLKLNVFIRSMIDSTKSVIK